MVHLQIVLDTRRAKADGSYSIAYRITYLRKTYTINSGSTIDCDHWDNSKRTVRKSHPNAQTINTAISKRFYEIQRAILKSQADQEFTYELFKLHLDGTAPLNSSVTFYQFAHQIIKELIETNRAGNALVYTTAVSRLVKFAGSKNLTFKQIDYLFLESFKNKLLTEEIKINSIGNYLRSIRAIYNKAIKAKIIERAYYPFHEISIKTEKTAKRAITQDELLSLYTTPLVEDSAEWHARNYFFLSFSLIGLSFTDLAYLKALNIKKNRITFRRRKTKKLYDIKLTPFAKRIFDFYKGKSDTYLIPIITPNVQEDGLIAKNLTREWIKATNTCLKRIASCCDIESNVTTYVARHTWATTARRMGYSIEIIAEALGHENGNKITNTYLESFDQNVIDEVNEKILKIFK